MIKKILKFLVGLFLLSVFAAAVYLGINFCRYKIALGEKLDAAKVQNLLTEGLSYFPKTLPPDEQNRIMAYINIEDAAYQYDDDAAGGYSLEDDMVEILYEIVEEAEDEISVEEQENIYNRLRTTNLKYEGIKAAVKKPQVALPLAHPESFLGLGGLAHNMSALIRAVSAGTSASHYTLAYCKLLAHDNKLQELTECLQIHNVLTEDLLSPPQHLLSILVAKQQRSYRAKIFQSFLPATVDRPQDRDLLRQTLLVEFVNMHFTTNQGRLSLTELTAATGLEVSFSDFTARSIHSFFPVDRDYAGKDILAMHAILEQKTGAISDDEQEAILTILEQDPRPMELIWLRKRGSLASGVRRFFAETEL